MKKTILFLAITILAFVACEQQMDIGYINENVNVSIQIPIPKNLSQKVDINDKSIDNKISEKIVITLE